MKRLLAALSLAALAACQDAPTAPVAPVPEEAAGLDFTREVTIDFSTHGVGPFAPRFYQSQGLVLPRRCRLERCLDWFVGQVQFDHALIVEPAAFAPVKGVFTVPTPKVFLRVAPILQGTARYVLETYAVDGSFIGRSHLQVTQDTGDSAHRGFGYFTIGIQGSTPIKSFKLRSVFVRSSVPQITDIPYGISSVSFTQ